MEGVSSPNDAPSINMRCPACRRAVTFASIGFGDAQIQLPETAVRTGQRKCGNPDCGAHLFVVLNHFGSEILVSYPAETIDFDASSIPQPVVDAFEEAIKCHAQQCFVASAIMVRKGLEMICADRAATGDNLHQRIVALGDKVVLPKAMLDGLDDLRLLGNDAAHVESRVYEDVGKEEVEVALEVAKEILKATYQYEDLMGRLRALKRPPAED